MKTLYIVRHAKSSWEDDALSDFERPLNERGKRDAPRMGKRLKEKDLHPDVMISSSARRAFSTAKIIATALNYPEARIVEEKKLYHANEDVMLSLLKHLNDRNNTVMIFGHNPGLTDFANSLSEKKWVTDNIPTSGVIAFELPIKLWNEITFGSGKVLFFDYPKSRED